MAERFERPPLRAQTDLGEYSERRYLWSPVVHRELHETCHFFIFATTDSRGQRLHEALSPIHEELGISGSTAYVIQGPYDLILRVWLTPVRRQTYLAALEEAGEQLRLATVYEFSATAVDYAWLSPAEEDRQRDLNGSPAFSGTWIQDLRDKLAEDLTPLPQHVEELTSSGFLIPVDDPSSRRIFMFISIDENSTRYPETTLHDQIRQAGAAAGLERISVYYDGTGLCDFVLKGFFEEELDKAAAIEQMQSALSNVGLVGWTLSPMRTKYIRGSESIDAIKESETEILARLLQDSHERYTDTEKIIANLRSDEGDGDRVLGLLDGIQREVRLLSTEQVATRVERRMLGVLAGLLSGSRKRVNRETSFLVSIPADLRDLVETMVSVLREPGAHSLNEISFDAMGHLLQRILLSPALDSATPKEFIDALPTLVQDSMRAREFFYSGQLFENAYAGSSLYEGPVEDQLRLVARAAVFQIHIEDLLEQEVDMNGEN